MILVYVTLLALVNRVDCFSFFYTLFSGLLEIRISSPITLIVNMPLRCGVRGLHRGQISDIKKTQSMNVGRVEGLVRVLASGSYIEMTGLAFHHPLPLIKSV